MTAPTKVEYDLHPGLGIVPVRTMETLQEKLYNEIGVQHEIRITKEKTSDGREIEKKTTVITGVDESFKPVYAFFAGSPCWFLGCEQLRSEFNAAIEASGGSKCQGCARGAIIREFTPRVKAAMDAHLASGGAPYKAQKPKPIIIIGDGKSSTISTAQSQNENTRTVEVSGSGSKSPERTGTFKQLLRRTTDGIKKIFGTSQTERKGSK